MSSVAKLMQDYFAPSNSIATPSRDVDIFSRGILREQRMPLVPTKMEWTMLEGPERFGRKFVFESRRRLVDFVNEILAFEDEAKHHGEIKITADSVEIEVYTHTVEQITELDREYIKTVGKIYQDVLDYGYEK